MAPRNPKKSVAPAGDDGPESDFPGEASPRPAKLKLGCAPLITGICLVALLGKFLPHEPRRLPSAAKEAPGVPRNIPPEAKQSQAGQQPAARQAPPKMPDVPKQSAVPAKSTPVPAAPAAAKPGIAAIVDGAIVSNSPWNGSVRQVERYLKNGLYDAASFEALEWSPVVETKKGYQVRCKYRSKNVLGVYVTQSKTFFLDKSGEVYAVKE